MSRVLPAYGALLALLAAAYVPRLSIDFLCDDFVMLSVHLLDGETVDWRRALSNFFPDWYGGRDFYRPLVLMGALLDWCFFRTDAWGYHLQNLLIHAASSAAILALAGRFLRGAPPVAPLFAASFFALGPVHPEAVLWIVGRGDLLETFFLLLALLLLLAHRSGRGRASLPLSWLSAGLAFLSKETAVTLPPALLLCDALHARRLRPLRDLLAVHGPYWLLLGAWLLLRKAAFGSFLGRYDREGPAVVDTFLRGLPSLPWDAPGFLAAMVAPVSAASFPEGRTALRLLLVLPIALAGLTGWSAGGHPARGTRVAAALFAVLVLPEIPFASQGFQPLDENLLNARMAYLPSAGLALLLAGLLFPVPRMSPGRWRRATGWVALALLCAGDLLVLRGHARRFGEVDGALRGLRDGLEARSGGRPLVLLNPPRAFRGVNAYWIGLEQSMAPPFRPRKVPVIGLDLVAAEGFEDFLHRHRGAPVPLRWDPRTGALAEGPTARGPWPSWPGGGLAASWRGGVALSLPTAGTDALELRVLSPEGGEGALSFEPADPRWPGEIRFPLRGGAEPLLHVVPLRFSRAWFAAGTVSRARLDLPAAAEIVSVAFLGDLPRFEAIGPPGGALVDLEAADPVFSHRAFAGARFYRLVLDLPGMPGTEAVYDASLLLGRAPREGEEVRRPLSHRPSLVSGFVLDRSTMGGRAVDLEVTWRIEALADARRPSVILGETAPRRLRVRGAPAGG